LLPKEVARKAAKRALIAGNKSHELQHDNVNSKNSCRILFNYVIALYKTQKLQFILRQTAKAKIAERCLPGTTNTKAVAKM